MHSKINFYKLLVKKHNLCNAWRFHPETPSQSLKNTSEKHFTFPRKPLNAEAQIQLIRKTLFCCYHGDGAGIPHYVTFTLCKQAKRAFSLMYVHYAKRTLMSREVRRACGQTASHANALNADHRRALGSDVCERLGYSRDSWERPTWETKQLHKEQQL